MVTSLNSSACLGSLKIDVASLVAVGRVGRVGVGIGCRLALVVARLEGPFFLNRPSVVAGRGRGVGICIVVGIGIGSRLALVVTGLDVITDLNFDRLFARGVC